MKNSAEYALKMDQGVTLTPYLIQSIRILAMSSAELEDLVNHELEENPLLEEIEPGSGLSGLSEFYDMAAPQPNVQEHLVRQLAELQLEEEDKNIALGLIGNIDEDGYLDIFLYDFAKTHGLEEKRCERVLDQIQHLQPAGIAARDLRECLLLQLESLHLEDSLAARVVRDFLKEMQAHQYKRIALAVGASENDVAQSVMAIKLLNPRPACNFDRASVSFRVPDVYVARIGDDWELSVSEQNTSRLCINESLKYKYSAKDSGVPGEYFNTQLKAANVLINAIEERKKTILEVAKIIIEKQNAFLEHGLQALVPLKMAEVASALGVNESTVSRAVKNKYIATPHGTLEMKRFFSAGLALNGNEAVASESVRLKLIELVRNEDKHAPLSDQKIAEAFSNQGIDVARRTVAKYREQLGLLPASLRKAA